MLPQNTDQQHDHAVCDQKQPQHQSGIVLGTFGKYQPSHRTGTEDRIMLQYKKDFISISSSHDITVISEKEGSQNMKSQDHQVIASIVAILQDRPHAKAHAVGQQKRDRDGYDISHDEVQMLDPAS